MRVHMHVRMYIGNTIRHTLLMIYSVSYQIFGPFITLTRETFYLKADFKVRSER